VADLSGTQRFILPVEGQATAGTADEFARLVVPFNAVVKAVSYVPKTTVTGAATNNFQITCRNRGAAGAGSTLPASLTFGNGTNASALTATALTLSSTASDLNLTAGDVITVEKIVNGTGMAMPSGCVVLDVQVR
jgi:hypothetical protein